MAQVVAKRYARALFNIAKENDAFEKYVEELKNLDKILHCKEVYRIVANRSIPIKDKIDLIDALIGNKFDVNVVNFIKLVISKHRESILDEIIYEFIAMCKEYYGIVDVELVSVHELNDAVIEKIKNNLELNLGKKVNIYCKLDPSIIGGLKIIIGNRVIDGSVKGRLNNLMKYLEEAM
ncbi:MAG: ATP synthase F1 subunit delta [Thermoanaerobacteraceae bacterium]|nr:ATP synthase F1 subunit delta [Thermoanaerobacteraceae bacterium]